MAAESSEEDFCLRGGCQDLTFDPCLEEAGCLDEGHGEADEGGLKQEGSESEKGQK